MKKRTLILTLTAALVAFGFLALLKFKINFLSPLNLNHISVTTEEPIKTEKVKIEFGISVNTIDRKSDLELFTNRSKYTILFNGDIKEQMINEYGENDFLITYEDKYYFSFRQFKFDHRNQHQYNFHLYKKDHEVFVEVDIQGQDAMRFERPMIEIYKAAEYVCNTPIDSAGGVYNMIELKNE